MIQVALNGSRPPADHPAIPTTPDQFAAEAQRAIAAGARAIHLHGRGPSGAESIAPGDVASVVGAVRAVAGDVPIGISTGVWIIRDPVARLAVVRTWTVLPDYASVNVREAGAVDLMALLIERGIGVEAGVWTAEDVALLVQSGLAPRCLRVLLEPMETTTDAARANVARMVELLDEHTIDRPRLLHGTGPTAWDMIAEAGARRYDTRVGFEDTITLPNGARASNNAELVEAAKQVIGRLG
jgi:uncharacterized protein (DUF849 family)